MYHIHFLHRVQRACPMKYATDVYVERYIECSVLYLCTHYIYDIMMLAFSFARH